MKKSILLLSLIFISFIACDKSAKSSTKDVVEPVEKVYQVALESGGTFDPIADTNAVPGGMFTSWGSSFPKSLNMWLDYNSFSVKISELCFEKLVDLHSTLDEPIGILAEKWEISEDKKTFIFTIHKDAQWSDGKPVTAEDVQFFYDVMMDKKNLTSLFRVSLSKIERPEIVDEKTIKVTAKGVHWLNFWYAGELYALPKHIWKDSEFNKLNFEFPVVSGPYELEEVAKGRYLILKRRGDWWGRVKRYNKNKFNFDVIKYKFMEDRIKGLEAFKKGVFDAYSVYTSSIWMKQTNFDAVKKGWVNRMKIYNKEPKGFQGFTINLRREKFKDIRVRQALSHLINRELMNEKLMYNQYFLMNSYYPDLYENNVNPKKEVTPFNPEKARVLFKEAGYKVDNDGILKKDGVPFSIVFLTASSEQRHLNIYIEDLKKVGIQVKIEQLSYSTLSKRMDNHDFDMYWTNWGATRLRNPESSWHSSTANEIATNNYSGVADPVIDSLIEVQKTEMDLVKRNEILKAIDSRLFDIVPYVLLWQSDNHRLLYWDKFGTPQYIYDKYEREESIVTYWWYNKEKADKLTSAMKSGETLSSESGEIRYQDKK